MAVEESMSTLDYAHRAKNIENAPQLNQRMTKKVVLKEYCQEIETLRQQLQQSTSPPVPAESGGQCPPLCPLH
jgi:hypothetical protein